MSCLSVQSFRKALRSTVQGIPLLFKNSLEYKVLPDIHSVAPELWNSLNFSKSIFLEHSTLKALGGHTEIDNTQFHYVVFYNKSLPVGIAVVQIAQLRAQNLEERISSGKWGSMISNRFLPKGKPAYILVCGSIFSTGEHGFSFDPSLPMQQCMNGLCEALTEISDAFASQGNALSAWLVKDFYGENFDKTKGLEKCYFKPFDVDHNMEMPLLSEWESFDDYLNALNTKFRTKANAALKRSSSLHVKSLQAKDIEPLQERMGELYDAVFTKADFKIGKLDCSKLCDLKRSMKDRMIVRGYYLEEKLIGFSTALIAENQLEAFMVGIDYQFNQEHAMYSRMLYDYIQLGIERKKTKIIFGRTAGEIKSSVGAFPVALKCCIKHPGKLPNVLLSVIFKYIEPTAIPIRRPYKEVTLRKIVSTHPRYSHEV